ncbi:hypothetical protein HNY73_001838 [Argiope bruennichi]|uniref:Uncharacterized protein n=1 Tax=Argiope bruennichi TaxID=94029 RepID=A0A8T0FVW9_ARGBR|nr:hypothetical protein HNY73_001838 [Argiope bruennichi]
MKSLLLCGIFGFLFFEDVLSLGYDTQSAQTPTTETNPKIKIANPFFNTCVVIFVLFLPICGGEVLAGCLRRQADHPLLRGDPHGLHLIARRTSSRYRMAPKTSLHHQSVFESNSSIANQSIDLRLQSPKPDYKALTLITTNQSIDLRFIAKPDYSLTLHRQI